MKNHLQVVGQVPVYRARAFRHRGMIALVLAGVIGLSAGCESNAGNGALIGAGGGALLGGIIGHQSGHAGTGALIGAGAGAVGGALVGNEMDKKEDRKRREAEQRRQDQQRYNQTAAASTVTKQDVIHWTARNTADDVIIRRIQDSGTTFYLTRADEQELIDNGVSPRVIAVMR